ncbi:MAG: hypothetical protein ACOYN0_11630, partial [Phycisphaerales bacterium]
MITATAAILVASLASQPEPVTVARGLTGTIRFEYKGTALRAKQNQTLTNPVVVRLNGDAGAYRLEFIGAVAGKFDLREYLEAVDGPLPTDVPPLAVSVVTQLPPNHGTDVFEGDSRGFSFEAHYFTALWVLGAAWIAIPAVIAARRALRRPPPAPVVVAHPAPSLADQLRELVLRAVAGSLSIAEQGKLELLLLTHWRERLSLQALSVPEAVTRLRSDATAGRLLREVERWLHAAPSPAAVPESRLQELLAPYLDAPAI